MLFFVLELLVGLLPTTYHLEASRLRIRRNNHGSSQRCSEHRDIHCEFPSHDEFRRFSPSAEIGRNTQSGIVSITNCTHFFDELSLNDRMNGHDALEAAFNVIRCIGMVDLVRNE